MKNHIKAKFLGLNYGEISKEKFEQMIPDLIEALRHKLPIHDQRPVQGVKVSVSNENLEARPENIGLELHMVDSKGIWGVRIGNGGIAISTAEYVAYDEVMTYLEELFDILANELRISHFSQVSLRNLNLFKEEVGQSNKFTDIKDGIHWGRQEIATLSSGYPCSGAATKHIYNSVDGSIQIQLSSAVVLENQSFIPQNEWSIWNLHGHIPVSKETQLMIDISSSAFQTDSERRNRLVDYSWEEVSKEFNKLHDLVNQVYTDITKD
jgi:uncharacterized protein (TIGR04255 family)